jgi:hypothetical protein
MNDVNHGNDFRNKVVRKMAVATAAAMIFFPCCAQVFAEVGDPTIETDHPDYSGEGVFQTAEKIVKHVTADKKTNQEKAIALWRWILTHQYHAQQPMEWSRGAKVPDSRNEKDNLLYLYDANRARFSYGYAMCGTAHAWNQVLWKALGFNARNRAFPGHSNSEIEYDGSWHTFDTDMAGLLLRKDGVVAGYEDFAADPTIFNNDTGDIPKYPFKGGFTYMQKSWPKVAAELRKNPNAWFKLYNVGYEGMPPIVRLRSGETFNRWFNPDHFGGRSERRYWNNSVGGPSRDWTFVNIPPAVAGKDARGNASYCNAEFIYEPNLKTAEHKAGVAEESNTAFDGQGLRSADGKEAFVIFEHISPYVIAGKAANGLPQTSPATDGLVIEGTVSGGEARVAVSNDDGHHWHDLGVVKDALKLDATDFVKGRWAWRVKFSFTEKTILDSLKFTTVCQMSQSIYPRLKAGGGEVTYRNTGRGLTRVQPFYFADEKTAEIHEVRDLREGELLWKGATPENRAAFHTPGGKPASIVYRLQARGPLIGFAAALNYTVKDEPTTPPELAHVISFSVDGGKTWKDLAKAKQEPDNELSSGWLYGKTDLPEGTGTEILCRIKLDCGPHPTDLCRLELYGVYQTAPAPETIVECGWKEGEQSRTHSETVPAGSTEKRFSVPTGAAIRDEFIRIKVR